MQPLSLSLSPYFSLFSFFLLFPSYYVHSRTYSSTLVVQLMMITMEKISPSLPTVESWSIYSAFISTYSTASRFQIKMKEAKETKKNARLVKLNSG